MPAKFLQGIDLNNKRGVNGADPTTGTDLANKQYVDNLVAGLAYKDEVRVATTANVALTTGGLLSIDGITLVAGNRVLVKNQTTASENGIYVAASGAWTRATDADSTADLNNATVYVTNGTVNGGREFTQNTKDPVVGTTAINWVEKQTGIIYSADGQGLELSGTTFALEIDPAGAGLSKSAAGLFWGGDLVAGNGLVWSSVNKRIDVGAGNGISVTADGVAVDNTIVPRKFSADNVVTTNPQDFVHNLFTSDVAVTVREKANGTVVYPDITISPSGNTDRVRVDFGIAPAAAGIWTVTVIG